MRLFMKHTVHAFKSFNADAIVMMVLGGVLSLGVNWGITKYMEPVEPYDNVRITDLEKTDTSVSGVVSFTKNECVYQSLRAIFDPHDQIGGTRELVLLTNNDVGDRPPGDHSFRFFISERTTQEPPTNGTISMITTHLCKPDPKIDSLPKRGEVIGHPGAVRDSDAFYVTKVLATIYVGI